MVGNFLDSNSAPILVRIQLRHIAQLTMENNNHMKMKNLETITEYVTIASRFYFFRAEWMLSVPS